MNINNGSPFDIRKSNYLTPFSKCTFFFTNIGGEENRIRATYNGQNILGFVIKETSKVTDLIINIPEHCNCVHYWKGNRTANGVISSSDTHLTYHGKAKEKKQSGEIHIKKDGRNILVGRANVLEAPISSSDDLSIYPLPLCRFELSARISNISLKHNINNYFEIKSNSCFFNTLDVYLASKGFMKEVLIHSSRLPEVLISMYAFTSLEGFALGKLVRRVGRFPQVLVVQSFNYEFIIININEYRNPTYDQNTLRFFHTKNYFKELTNRYCLTCEEGYFIDKWANEKEKNDRFFKINDLTKQTSGESFKK